MPEGRFGQLARLRTALLQVVVVVGVLLLAAPPLAHAIEKQAAASSVFERYSANVVQVRVLERESGAKASFGSGFFASRSVVGARVVTNFHVVSERVHHPGRYRIEVADSAGNSIAAKVVAVDLLHDLAVLQTESSERSELEIRREPLAKGTRLYSLGNPYDLGMSIVEGTYNGLLEHSRADRIHFTGGLNPGMSGGPAILASGEVAGVNVATAGNAVSFLVPAVYALDLLERAPTHTPGDGGFSEQIGRQLWKFQQVYVEELLAAPLETVRLGHYRVPTRPLPFFNCGGDKKHGDKDHYTSLFHWCSSDDDVFFRRNHSFELLRMRHRQVESDKLGAFPFYALYGSFFEQSYSTLTGNEQDFTEFRCQSDFVRNGSLSFKAVFCLRRYRQIEGLYDVIFKAAALGQPDTGLETALRLSGVSFESARRLAQRHLESISWIE